MIHKGTTTLETERLILRKFAMEDAEEVFANWTSDPEVTKFLKWSTHPSVDYTKEIISKWITGYESNKCYQWAIILKEINKPIGSIAVVRLNENTKSAELGYCMGTKWWGKGIMPEAGQAVIKYLFEEIGLNRVAAVHAKPNPKSGRVMQKLGMKYDGTIRSAGFCNEGIVDEVWYSILREEYFKDTVNCISKSTVNILE